MNIKKTALLMALVTLAGAQCSGAANKPQGLGDMTPEIQEEIANYLDAQSRGRLAQASTQLRNVTSRERKADTFLNLHEDNINQALLSATAAGNIELITIFLVVTISKSKLGGIH